MTYPFTNKDLKNVHAPSRKFHLRYLLGVPDEWEGHEGDILIVSQDDPYEMVFANYSPTGIVITEKVRIDPLEPAKYLGDLVDNDTVVVIGTPNNKRIAVSDQFLKTTGGHITGNITLEPGVTIDGIDLSDIYNVFFNKLNTMYPEVVQSEVIFQGSVTFLGNVNLSGSTGGAVSFTQLLDVPNSYTGEAGKFVKVKNTENGLEFTSSTPSGISFKTEIITLNSSHISSKQITLSETPSDFLSVMIHIASGLPGTYNLDFSVSGNTISWNSKSWDGILEIGDTLSIFYPY